MIPGLSHAIKPKSYIALLSMSVFGRLYDEFGVPPALSSQPSKIYSFYLQIKVKKVLNSLSLKHEMLLYTVVLHFAYEANHNCSVSNIAYSCRLKPEK